MLSSVLRDRNTRINKSWVLILRHYILLRERYAYIYYVFHCRQTCQALTSREKGIALPGARGQLDKDTWRGDSWAEIDCQWGMGREERSVSLGAAELSAAASGSYPSLSPFFLPMSKVGILVEVYCQEEELFLYPSSGFFIDLANRFSE